MSNKPSEDFNETMLLYLKERSPGAPEEKLKEQLPSLHNLYLLNQASDFQKWLNKKNKVKKEREEKQKEINYVKTSCFEFQDKIYEQVYNDGMVSFCSYNKNTKEILFWNDVQTKDNEYLIPINDEEVHKGFIMLPSEPEEYENDDKLDEEIRRFINKWLDIPSDDIEIGILTTKKSWIYQRFNTLNYLRVLGDFGAGKSRYLDVFSAIHYKSLKTTGTVTPAALFRVIGKWGGTIAIDEADRAQGDETDEVLKIINQGYEEGNPVLRCDPNDQSKVDFHNVYCPKILSSRKPFEDKATESRCFTSILHSTTRKDIPPNRNDSFKADSLKIRNKLLMWRFRNYYTVNPEAGSTIDLGISDPRLRQISNGFVSLFLDNEERLVMFKRMLLEREKELIDERSQSWEGRIVKAIIEMTIENARHITASDIIYRADLRDWKSNEQVKPRALTKYMKSLGFAKTVTVREGNTTLKDYKIDPEYLVMLAPRYVADGDLVEKLRYHVTNVTVHTEGGVNSNENKESADNVVNKKNEEPLYNGNNGNTVTDNSMKLELAKAFIRNHPRQNSYMIETQFGSELVSLWLSKGDLYQHDPETYLF